MIRNSSLKITIKTVILFLTSVGDLDIEPDFKDLKKNTKNESGYKILL